MESILSILAPMILVVIGYTIGSTKIVKKSMCRFRPPPVFSEKAFLSNLIREGLAPLLKVKEKISFGPFY